MTTEAASGPILLVEDNTVDLDLALRAFARRDRTSPLAIEVARDGEEALAFLPRWESGHPTPAVILLDNKLPRVSGLDVLRKLKTHERFRRIPVVMLTSSTEDEDVRTAYAAGVNSYIVKPIEFGKFIEVAEQIEVYWCTVNHSQR
ncbi:response regulator [Aromatoleum aromaticum]|uniref:Two component response regulator n=1 Tax=Aromatoleum aromaticum (strain DSM 19018 / LMG 30748 / EbN1) TaxID=76114 RepID=Q5P4F8_AROAE|nr:response regulator [Aromatoleum aromaticum]NMG53579.1 response regulator [Aromatoleum aromaticum]CAI07805.1 putative two component response regulator [Aromatoleum aromaticum EbN1]